MTANFIYYAASVVGGGVGIALAGLIIDHIGLISHLVPTGEFTRETWRLVFFAVALPGPVLAIAIVFLRLNSRPAPRSAEHTSELQSLMRISYAVFCLKQNNKTINQ